MKKTENAKAGIFDTFKYSLKHRISAFYTMIFIIVCLIIILLFSAGSIYHETGNLRLQTDELSEYIATLLESAPPESDEVRFYLNSLRRDGILDEIYIYDSQYNFLNGTKIPVNISKNLSERFAATGYKGNISLKNMRYTDEAKITVGTESYTILVWYDISSTVRSTTFGVGTMALSMLIGLIVFNVAGHAQTTRMLKPIEEISYVAKKISGENLNLRFDTNNSKFELNELGETINDMMDRIQLSYDRQKRFVSDVSHELRTPIAVISGYGSLLKRWGKEDEAILDESIDAIISETANMQDLVEKLLFLTRSDNKTTKYEFKKINMSTLTTSVIKEEEMVHQDFDFNADIDNNIYATVDEMSIRQFMRIIIDNAVKYSGESKTVDISLKSKKDCFELCVKDYGVGISKKDLSKIFDRFYRADESRAKQTGGYGLGLSIAKAIIDGHKGKTIVRTKPDAGTSFTVAIPYKNINTEE